MAIDASSQERIRGSSGGSPSARSFNQQPQSTCQWKEAGLGRFHARERPCLSAANLFGVPHHELSYERPSKCQEILKLKKVKLQRRLGAKLEARCLDALLNTMKIFVCSKRNPQETGRLRDIPAVRYWSVFAAMAIAFAGMAAAQGQTTSAILTLTPGNNAITASGSVSAIIAGLPFSAPALPQAAGSDVTQWTGTISVTLDDPTDPTTVSFVSANLVAQDSGSWEPGNNGVAGTAPANYGFMIRSILNGDLALRNAIGSLSSAPLGLGPSGESLSFLSSGIEYSAEGVVDLNGSISGSRRVEFGDTASNRAAAHGGITLNGYVVSIQIPLDVPDTLILSSFAGATVRFVGTLNAQGVLQAPPPKLISVGREISGTRLRWQQVIPGAVYRVQSNDDLIDDWQDVAGTLTANTNGTIEFFDSTSPAPIQRFYRLVSPP